MNYFETAAGYNFTQYVIPDLICKIEELTAELKRANSLKEQELMQRRNGLWTESEDENEERT